ncbi:hypothetical protein [Priestia megaterium]|uniref:hypothetical protein n=1 Tax=Priestia megaterium TaxID=1404 RepID=UPI00245324EB|nr:hypothetical protein [Priestia megaterium]MDH3144524.1 hypothetical protein [Priestia megaterium]MED4238219.1 hypothetical protein [Priestia megaterium]MED4253509.1 hypothetical protein [Priestia megaterium]
MKLTLLILLIATISSVYILLTLNKSLSLTKNVMTPKQYLTNNINFKGYIVIFEKNMFIHDFNFYKSVFQFLSKDSPCTMISIDLSIENLDNGELLKKLDIKNIPSIHYINGEGISTEIINFINIEESLNVNQIMALIKRKVEKI